MPMCTYPEELGGCDAYAIRNSDRCQSHQVRTRDLQKLEAQAITKARREADARDRNERERAERDARANAIRERQARRDAEQAEVIRKHIQTWSAQIQTVFDQVEVLRATDSKANAGYNDSGNTEGGNQNPVKLVLSGPTHGVTHAQICSRIQGFESSDSGVFKYRRKTATGSDIFIHCG